VIVVKIGNANGAFTSRSCFFVSDVTFNRDVAINVHGSRSCIGFFSPWTEINCFTLAQVRPEGFRWDYRMAPGCCFGSLVVLPTGVIAQSSFYDSLGIAGHV
jgi:hypothetical protein